MKKWIVALLIAGALLLGALLWALRRETPSAAAVPAVPLATATPVPSPTPAPTPSPTPVPTPAPRSQGWFGEAVFVGDSVTRALENYCRRHDELGEPLFLCEVSLSARNIAEGQMGVQYRGQELPLPEALAQAGASRVFIMLGTNDVALPGGVEAAMTNWAWLLDQLRERCPGMEIYVESALPMSTRGELRDLNNQRLREYNDSLRALCRERGCSYLDLAPWFTGEDGGLPEEYCSDGYVHLTEEGAALWASLLQREELYEEKE